MRALVADPALAVGPSPSGRAAAGVAALAGVPARGTVLTRPVVGAVVEVEVAEEAAPALVAPALVRLAARAMLASWVPDALVAQRTRPARLAPEDKDDNNN